MAESKKYRLPNTEGDYVTVSVTDQSGEIYRVNDDGTRTIYADYFVENGNTVLEASTFSSEEFQRNLAQNSQGYNRTVSNSILDANGQTNSQPDPNQPGSDGGSTPTNPNEGIDQQTTSITDFRYPEKLSRDQDVIQFMAVKYIPSGLNTPGTIAQRTQRRETETENGKRNIEGTVTLPIQAKISDSNTVGWGPGTLDEITRSALGTVYDVATDKFDPKGFAEKLQGAARSFANDQQNRDIGLAYLAEKILDIQNVQGRTGGVLNPNFELLFNGPTLRPFGFRFRLTPRTKKESEIVRGIIKFFKKNMAVKKDQSLFLKAPNTFLIKYLGKNDDDEEGPNEKKSLNKIKECALVGFDVDYTPQGSYMTFEDGSMVSYVLDLKFTELTPIYDTDYDNDHPIGF